MAKESNTAATQNLAHGEAPFREFAYADLTPEQSKKQAVPLLNSKELLRSVRALPPGDQQRFIDKVDQVCTEGRIFFLEIYPPLFPQRHIQLSIRKMQNS